MNTSIDIHRLVNKIQSIIAEFDFYSIQDRLKSIEYLLKKDSLIDIAVVGQFKAGKSSFVNSLIGFDILPTGVIPVTTVITRLKYSEHDKASIITNEGITHEIGFDEIISYVSEAENPLNEKNIKYVDLELKKLSNYKLFRFVDTPGMGSIYKHNTDITFSWIPNTAVAFVVISCDKPLSDEDLDLIKEVGRHSPRTIILLTKADLFTQVELEEISSFIKGSLEQKLKKCFELFYFSCFKQEREYISKLNQEFFYPVIEDFDIEYMNILQHKIFQTAKSCLSYLEVSYKASLQNEYDKDHLKKMILDEKTKSGYIKEELLLIGSSYINSTRDKLHRSFDNYSFEIIKHIQQEFSDSFPNWRGNLYKITREFEKFLCDNLQTSLEKVIESENSFFESLTDQAKTHFATYIRSFRERINTNLQKVLGITIPKEEWNIFKNDIIKPDISSARVFDFQIDLFWFLFPISIFRRIFYKHFWKQIPIEVEKNLYRLASDMTEKINKQINDYREQAYTFITLETSSIENTLNADMNESGKIKRYMDELSNSISMEEVRA